MSSVSEKSDSDRTLRTSAGGTVVNREAISQALANETELEALLSIFELARRQAPVALDARALGDRIGIGRRGDIAGKSDGNLAYLRGLARLDGDHDRRALVGAVFTRNADVGVEVAQRADEVAHIALGQDDQPRQLGFVKISDRSVALQFKVFFKHFPHDWRSPDGDVESGDFGFGAGRPNRTPGCGRRLDFCGRRFRRRRGLSDTRGWS